MISFKIKLSKKYSLTNHIFMYKNNLALNLSLWDEVKITDRTDRKEYWRVRCFKELAHMLGYSDLLSRPSIEMNTIWEPIIKKIRLEKS